MQTLAAVNAMRLSIPGKFWDSQVYAGGLFLFGTDGSLTTFSWRRLVAELPVAPHLRFAADAALLGNRLYYEAGAQSLLRDDAIKEITRSRFAELAKGFGNSFEVQAKHGSKRANR